MTEDTSPENLRKFLESDDSEKLYEFLDDLRESGHEEVENIISEFIDANNENAGDLLLNSLNEIEIGEEFWIGEPILDAITDLFSGTEDEDAAEVLSNRFSDECDYAMEFYMDHNPNSEDGPYYRTGETAFLCYETAATLASIGGNKVQERLREIILLCEPWWESHVAFSYWEGKPRTDEERIACLIANHDWEKCKEMGELAVKQAVKSLSRPIYCFEGITCVFGEIEEAINSFGEKNVIRIIKEENTKLEKLIKEAQAREDLRVELINSTRLSGMHNAAIECVEKMIGN